MTTKDSIESAYAISEDIECRAYYREFIAFAGIDPHKPIDEQLQPIAAFLKQFANEHYEQGHNNGFDRGFDSATDYWK